MNHNPSRILSQLNRNFTFVKCKPASKHPFGERWQYLTFDEAVNWLENSGNIGILLGKENHWLVDIDIDSDVALSFVDLLPPTGVIWGRDSKPYSHFLYISQASQTIRWMGDNKTLIELRSTGGYSIFPPSKHPSGEIYTFYSNNFEQIAEIDFEELKRVCTLIAIGSLVVKFWHKGNRHALTMHLTGKLARAGYSVSDVKRLIEKMCEITEDEEKLDRLKAVEDTFQKFQSGQPVTGLPSLKDLIGETAEKLNRWLTIKDENSGVFTLEDLLQFQASEIKFFIPDLLPEGLTLIAGRPKIGKSWFALQLALALSGSLENFAGFIPEDSSSFKVLYLALEDTPNRISRRLQVFDLISTKNLIFAFQASLNDLEAFLFSHRPDILIIDTIQMIKPPNTRKRDAYEVDYEFFGKLRDLSQRYNCSIIGIHHLRKTRAEDEPIYEVYGSVGVTGAVDTIFILQRGKHDTNARNLIIYGRDIEEQSHTFEFVDGKFNYIGETEYVVLGEAKRQILDILNNGEKLSPKEISELTNLKSGYVRKILSELKKNGIIQYKNGRYWK